MRVEWRTALRIAAAIAVLALLVVFGRSIAPLVPAAAARVAGWGIWGALAFVAAYALLTVALVPGSLLTLAAGAIFGLVWGTVLVLAGATLGACLAFLVARHVARGAVERRIAGRARVAAVDQAIAGEGWKIVVLLRLSPVVPFAALNYALGLTRVRFVDYALASVGMLPGTLLYVYYGTVAGSVAAAASGHARARSPASWAVLGLGLLATVLVTTLVTRLAGRALRDGGATDNASPQAARSTP